MKPGRADMTDKTSFDEASSMDLDLIPHAAQRRETAAMRPGVAVAVLAVMIVVLGPAHATLSESTMAPTLANSIQAFYIADGAVERAAAVLRLDPNWNDGRGAVANATAASFEPLVDRFQPPEAADDTDMHPFPAVDSIGAYTILVRRPRASEHRDPVNTIWVRADGTAGGVTRSIEVLLRRLRPSDFAISSAGTTSVLQETAGSLTIHGSGYFFSDAALRATVVRVENDRPTDRAAQSGRTTDAVPFANQLYVRGTLDASSRVSIGTAGRPLAGVHASHINNRSGTIYALSMDNAVPSIPYPNVAAYAAHLAAERGYRNALAGGAGQMVVCTDPRGKSTHITVANLSFGSTYFFVPTDGNRDCRMPAAGAGFMLVWDPTQAVPLRLNSRLAAQPILVPRRDHDLAADHVCRNRHAGCGEYPRAGRSI